MKKQITMEIEKIDSEGYNYGVTFRNTRQYNGYYHEKTVSMNIIDRNDFLESVKEILKFIKDKYKEQKTQENIYYARICYTYQLKKNNQSGDFGYCTKKTTDYKCMGANMVSNLKRLYETFDRYEYINIYRIEFVNRSGN